MSTPVTPATGCRIGRISHKPPTGDITYADQVSRLVQRNCVRCHRPGQIAPFSLITYDDVVAWAETMREVIDERRMPPWHANPQHGQFTNDAHMSDADKQTFRKWVENGMPKGDLRNLPMPNQYNDDWQIGKPTVVYKMQQPYKVPAKGVAPYQYFHVAMDVTDDVWVKGAEIRPGNRAVVHHVFVFFLPPGQDEPRAENPLFNAIAGFAPGMPAGLWPDGYARLIPAESKLVFQVHYTPNGSGQMERRPRIICWCNPHDRHFRQTRTNLCREIQHPNLRGHITCRPLIGVDVIRLLPANPDERYSVCDNRNSIICSSSYLFMN